MSVWCSDKLEDDDGCVQRIDGDASFLLLPSLGNPEGAEKAEKKKETKSRKKEREEQKRTIGSPGKDVIDAKKASRMLTLFPSPTAPARPAIVVVKNYSSPALT